MERRFSGYDRHVSGPGAKNVERSPTGTIEHPLTPLTLDQREPRARGRAQGEHWREPIRELAERRMQWTVEHGGWPEPFAVLETAAATLAATRSWRPDLADELEGIAEGADVSVDRLMVLNAFPELRHPSQDRAHVPAASTSEPGEVLIYFKGQRGPLLGLAWDLPDDARPFVRMLRIAPTEGADEILCLTVTGCLGVAGIGSGGQTVASCALTSRVHRVGPPWPALVRSLLALPRTQDAKRLLETSPRAGGRFYLLADGHDYCGVETTAERAVTTQLGPRAAHLHTNHYFDPVLRQHEAPRSPASFHRLNLVTTLYAQQRPRDIDGLWSLLGAREDPSAPVPPHRTLMAMRLGDGHCRVAHGGTPESALELGVDRFVGSPGPEDGDG